MNPVGDVCSVLSAGDKVLVMVTGTPLHCAAKVGNNKKAIRFLIENGSFLAPDMGDVRFNPSLHYCPGLEYAYKFNKQMQGKDSSGSGEDDKEGD